MSLGDNSVRNWRNLPMSNPKYKYTYQIWWQSIEIYSSYCPESKRQNLPIINPKADLHNINADTKFGENPLMFTKVII